MNYDHIFEVTMTDIDEQVDKILNNRINNDMTPEFIEGNTFEGEGDGEFFEGDGVIGDAFDNAIEEAVLEKKAKVNKMKTKASKKRKTVNQTKKKLGIRTSKQSKFNTRSHEFLGLPVSDRAIHVVMNQHRSDIYKDGVDICPRILMGIPGFGNASKKNAFNHLATIQEKIKTARGDNPANAPKWIIISNDSSMLNDRNLITRLEELNPTTHVAGAYGFQEIRASGRWYDVEGFPTHNFRGCYIQGAMDDINWDFIVGHEFKIKPKNRILIVHGPFIAVRGETFMQMDFNEMSENCKRGFYHYMADISMQCATRGLIVAQIKSSCMQFDNVTSHRDDEEMMNDQSYFTSKWQSILPRSIFS